MFSIKRALSAIGGSAGVSLSSLIMSVVLLSKVSAEAFGLFAFFQVAIGLGYGISNALLGSPLMVMLNREAVEDQGCVESYFKVCLYTSFFASAILFLICSLMADPILGSAIFLTAVLMWIRWFYRSYANTTHNHRLVVVSDSLYSSVTLCGAIALLLTDNVSLVAFVMLQSVGAAIGIVSFGLTILLIQCRSVFAGGFKPFIQGFRSQGRHALVGVISTEATTNAHAYVVTFMFGPAAFAPLAAALLLFRPVPIVIMSLTQLERPRIARLIRDKNISGARLLIKKFRSMVLSFWAVNILLAILMLSFFLSYLPLAGESPELIYSAAVFWGIITGIRCLRGPESAFLQANGNFSQLANTTVKSCLITLPLVFILSYALGPVWSLLGVVVGETFAAWWIMKLARSSGVNN